MRIPDEIKEAFEKNGGLLRTAQLVEAGRSKPWIGLCVRAGLLVRLGHGVYARADGFGDDVAALLSRSGIMVLSHESALYLNGLSEGAPDAISVTIPSNRRLSTAALSLCKCHYVRPDLHDIGSSIRKTAFGNDVRCYDAERTICDVFRARNRMDSETVLAAFRNYVAAPERNLPKLARYARAFGIFERLHRQLEVAL